MLRCVHGGKEDDAEIVGAYVVNCVGEMSETAKLAKSIMRMRAGD